MFAFDMLFETDRFIIECRTIKAAYEACVFQYQFFLLLFTSQIGKCVNDDTENEIQYDDDYDEKEQQIVYDASDKETFLVNQSRTNFFFSDENFLLNSNENLTVLLGALNISPMPPPLRNP